MMGHSLWRIVASVLSAASFGAIFSCVLAVASSALEVGKRALVLLKEIVRFEHILPLPSFRKYIFEENDRKDMPVWLSISAIPLFAIGFSLLSYLTLDGQLRIYMLLISSAALYLSNIVFSNFFHRLFLLICTVFFAVISLPIRCLIAPFRALLRFFISRVGKNKNKMLKKDVILLDKIKIK